MNRRALAGVFALALAVRVAAALVLGVSGPAVEDERGYVEVARSVARGEGFALPLPQEAVHAAGVRQVPPRTAFRAPLLPLVLSPVAAVGGGPGAMRWVNLLLGALGAPMLLLALRGGPLGARAWIPAAAYALWPPHVYLSIRVLSEPLSQTLLLGGVALLAPRMRTGARTGMAGMLAGLAVLARPAALLPAALLTLVAGERRQAAAFAAAFALVLVPWVGRNVALHGRPLLTTSTGVTLVGGNSAAALDARPAGKWVPPSAVYSGRTSGPDLGMWGWSELGEGASDARFAADAGRWVRGNPGAAAALAATKVARLVDPDPRSAKEDAGLKSVLGWITLPPVLLLGLLAVVRRRVSWKAHGAWIVLLGGTAATALVFYGDTRMRTAADPALLAVAASACIAAPQPERVRGRKR